jgi:hypothetical protein
MRNLNIAAPDFTPAPTTMELNDIMHEPHTDAYLKPWTPLVAAAQTQPEPTPK